MENEVWKKIPYSNEYEVSNLGGFRHLYINRYDINTKMLVVLYGNMFKNLIKYNKIRNDYRIEVYTSFSFL